MRVDLLTYSLGKTLLKQRLHVKHDHKTSPPMQPRCKKLPLYYMPLQVSVCDYRHIYISIHVCSIHVVG